MSIGDVNSTARGSGARYNDGKGAYELLPLRVVLDIIKWDALDRHLIYMIERLADWQAGDDAALDRAIEAIMPVPAPWLDTFADAARVFDYGRKKYAAWNWAKGMPWSVPLGCTIRHALKELEGQELDDESGLPHRGHIHCNLLMLKQYALSYPEGDDRPKNLAHRSAAGPNSGTGYPAAGANGCAGEAKSHRRMATPEEQAAIAPQCHPMHAESLRTADERPGDLL